MTGIIAREHTRFFLATMGEEKKPESTKPAVPISEPAQTAGACDTVNGNDTNSPDAPGYSNPVGNEGLTEQSP